MCGSRATATYFLPPKQILITKELLLYSCTYTQKSSSGISGGGPSHYLCRTPRSTTIAGNVDWGSRSRYAADDVGPASRVSALFEEDPAGAVSGRDGCGDAVGRVVGAGRSVLLEGRDGPQASGACDRVCLAIRYRHFHLPQNVHNLLRRVLPCLDHCLLLPYQFVSLPLVQNSPGTPPGTARSCLAMPTFPGWRPWSAPPKVAVKVPSLRRLTGRPGFRQSGFHP